MLQQKLETNRNGKFYQNTKTFVVKFKMIILVIFKANNAYIAL